MHETSYYDYVLPENKIAKFPLRTRDKSKLLFARRKTGTLEHYKFEEICELLPHNALLIRNNAKVIPARLLFQKETGATAEIFLLKPLFPENYEQNLNATHATQWEVALRGNVKQGTTLRMTDPHDTQKAITAHVIKKDAQSMVQFEWSKNRTFNEIIESIGAMPIPPYLKRKAVPSDRTTYQTIYAANAGAVAAPTAGLHFTPQIMQNLLTKKIDTLDITLHVGFGTFKPITSKLLSDHIMHEEHAEITQPALASLIDAIESNRKIIAIGTTVVRTIESLVWLGMKINASHSANTKSNALALGQFEHNTLNQTLKGNEPLALHSLKNIWNMIKNDSAEETLRFKTALMIVPPYHFHVIDGLITNFHQPKSTLLALVDAFVQNANNNQHKKIDWRTIYDEALRNEYRFLSYGDSSFIY
ncbi:hypothetical protein CHS0354_023948 [Potamilus streckersoni]|uniref:S-adenosylmethionine:tRNA ribosyltransferase-isomerase n=1 Tax=Potamilus streckersoni TaxID=2493646 RepID=A0AAE0VL86_9BIVA|nr:hypothetical protein CHS0354_023948 [Potamilus streckersoni]